jgi:hypothetical protein
MWTVASLSQPPEQKEREREREREREIEREREREREREKKKLAIIKPSNLNPKRFFFNKAKTSLFFLF